MIGFIIASIKHNTDAKAILAFLSQYTIKIVVSKAVYNCSYFCSRANKFLGGSSFIMLNQHDNHFDFFPNTWINIFSLRFFAIKLTNTYVFSM